MRHLVTGSDQIMRRRVSFILPTYHAPMRRVVLGVGLESRNAASRTSFAAASMPAARYSLGKNKRLVVDQGDITSYRGDAIVNAANEACLGGAGVDGAIHRAAGPGLLQECRKLPEVTAGVRCPTGKARITGGHALPAKHVIHTVGPVYKNSQQSSPLLYSAYKNSLNLANSHGLKSIAFPAISCGVYGYPIQEAAEICVKACIENVGDIEEVVLMQFSSQNFDRFKSTAAELLEQA